MQRIISFLSGILMGALVGATVALLLAPSSGEQMRARLQERGKQLSDEVREAAAARRAELEQQLASLRAPQKGA